MQYDPVPTGIGPVSTVWAQAMRGRGHDVDVVSAHPHYPAPDWGTLTVGGPKNGVRPVRLMA